MGRPSPLAPDRPAKGRPERAWERPRRCGVSDAEPVNPYRAPHCSSVVSSPTSLLVWLGRLQMALSLIGFFCSMMSVLAVCVYLLGGILSLSPSRPPYVATYPSPAEQADTLADGTGGVTESDEIAGLARAALAQADLKRQVARHTNAEGQKRLKQARAHKPASPLRQPADAWTTAALGYNSAPSYDYQDDPPFTPRF